MTKWLAPLLAIMLILIPSIVSADELWILNEGGTSITDMNIEAAIAEYNETHGWMNGLPF